MSATAAVPLRFQIGARTLWSVRRRLVRTPLSLADALADRAPVLPPLAGDADGYLITSLPVERLPALARADLVAFVRQQYTRHHVDLTIGYDAWWAGRSGNARSALKRKAKRLAGAPGGMAVERFAAPDAVAAFLPRARAVAVVTYQERLLGAGLPDTPAFERDVIERAAAGDARGWLLTVGGRDIAYLFGTAEGDALRYDHVGHHPDWADWSPGTVLQTEALRDLFEERRFARFDFLEGEGQHKRQFATGGFACCDVLLLRRTPANRAALAALAGFDAAVEAAKRNPALRALARRIGR